MALLHKKENDHSHEDKRSNKYAKEEQQYAKDKQTAKPEKALLTGEFIILEKFGDHVLRCLAF